MKRKLAAAGGAEGGGSSTAAGGRTDVAGGMEAAVEAAAAAVASACARAPPHAAAWTEARMERGTSGMQKAAEKLCTWCMDRDSSLVRAQVEGQAFVIADMTLPDQPIMFTSEGFVELSGYSRDEIVGKNCRFMQGPDTDKQTVQQIRDAVSEGRSLTVNLLNYRKNGSKFWNQLQLVPVKDSQGKVEQYVGTQQDYGTPVDGVSSGAPQSPRGACILGDEGGPMTSIASLLACEAEDMSLIAAYPEMRATFVISNPLLPDAPMTHVSDGFLKLTGYSRSEVIGKNCRFLQGPRTDPDTVIAIREAVQRGGAITVKLLNYRKDGSEFWNMVSRPSGEQCAFFRYPQRLRPAPGEKSHNDRRRDFLTAAVWCAVQLHVSPVHDNQGRLCRYVGCQMDITADMEGVTDAGLQGRLPPDEESSGSGSVAKQIVGSFPQNVLSGRWEDGFKEANEKVTGARMDGSA
jgi:PAS domain S-box-containing protein